MDLPFGAMRCVYYALRQLRRERSASELPRFGSIADPFPQFNEHTRVGGVYFVLMWNILNAP